MAYKNPNYDPQKAHEYYEKHKKLKGRKKATRQEEQMAYAQSQLQRQQRSKNARAKHWIGVGASEEQSRIAQQRAEQTKRLVSDAGAKINDLREKYMNASPEEQDAMREKISNAILNLREKTKKKAGILSQKASDESAKVSRQAQYKTKKAVEKNQKGYEKAVEKAKKRINGK